MIVTLMKEAKQLFYSQSNGWKDELVVTDLLQRVLDHEPEFGLMGDAAVVHLGRTRMQTLQDQERMAQKKVDDMQKQTNQLLEQLLGLKSEGGGGLHELIASMGKFIDDKL